MPSVERTKALFNSYYDDFKCSIEQLVEMQEQENIFKEASDLIDNRIEDVIQEVKESQLDKDDKEFFIANFLVQQAKTAIIAVQTVDSLRAHKLKNSIDTSSSLLGTFSKIAIGVVSKSFSDKKYSKWYEKAEEFLTKSLSVAPLQPTYYFLGVINEEKNLIEDAVKYYAIAQDGDDDELSIQASKDLIRVKKMAIKKK